jgi:hypothetical protein
MSPVVLKSYTKVSVSVSAILFKFNIDIGIDDTFFSRFRYRRYFSKVSLKTLLICPLNPVLPIYKNKKHWYSPLYSCVEENSIAMKWKRNLFKIFLCRTFTMYTEPLDRVRNRQPKSFLLVACGGRCIARGAGYARGSSVAIVQ